MNPNEKAFSKRTAVRLRIEKNFNPNVEILPNYLIFAKKIPTFSNFCTRTQFFQLKNKFWHISEQDKSCTFGSLIPYIPSTYEFIFPQTLTKNLASKSSEITIRFQTKSDFSSALISSTVFIFLSMIQKTSRTSRFPTVKSVHHPNRI